MPIVRSLILCLALTGPALAETAADRFAPKRGLNVDLWIEWRSIAEMLSDPPYLEVYPDWRRVITPEMYGILAAEGFDFVRLPMDPGPLLAMGPGKAQDALIADMRDGAEEALAAGLKAIVDLHPMPRGDETGGMEDVMAELWPDYVAFVGRVARALAGLPPDRVAFELLNEPTIDCEAVYAGAPAIWPDMLAELHAAAREGAPDLPLVLSGACWGGVEGLAALDPNDFSDNNILWSFHSYAPFAFTHQGASWGSSPLSHITGLPYPPSLMTPKIMADVVSRAAERMTAQEGAADIDAITAEIAGYMDTPDSKIAEDILRAADWADAHGIPRTRLLLGEFGALHTVEGVPQPREWYHAFLSDKRQAAETAGIGWAVLSYAGGMGVAIDGDPERRLAPETCRALGLLPCSK
jgi:endoglucanase